LPADTHFSPVFAVIWDSPRFLRSLRSLMVFVVFFLATSQAKKDQIWIAD
jgi:hypothetical protein